MNYYKRNIGDYAAATRHLNIVEHGAYMLLLDFYYTHECALPAEVREVCRRIGARSKDEQVAVDTVLTDFFMLNADGWRQNRCDKEIEIYQSKAETNRVTGRLGGRPKKRAQPVDSGNPEITQAVPEINPYETLNSNQEPVTKNQEPITKEGTARATRTPPVEKPSDVDEQVWQDWLQLRKAKRATVTKTVIDGAVIEAAKAGMTLNDFLTTWCRRGSQGLEADWLKARGRAAFCDPANPNKQEALELRNRKVAAEWVADMQASDRKTNATGGEILETI